MERPLHFIEHIIEEDLNLGYVSSNRDGQQGSSDDDIYRIQFYNCSIDITGVVVDSETDKPTSNNQETQQVQNFEVDSNGKSLL